MTQKQVQVLKTLKQAQKDKTRDKKFATMSAVEKWELVETLAKMFGLID